MFRHREHLEKHINAGAKRAVLTVPPKDELDATVVLGVNDHILTGEEKRFFSKTANIKLGEARSQRKVWRPTSKNKKARPDNIGRKKNYNNMVKESLSMRVCYSHEYIGDQK